jgi:prepilin-type N-terminal cleavage/methylation domain-containing protein
MWRTDAFHHDARLPRMRTRSRRRGFTLIEAALAMTIVGVGVLAMVRLTVACTTQNAAADHMTASLLLAGNIQEAMAGLALSDPAYGRTYFGAEPGQTLASYDDVDDFVNQTFNPPIDSTRARIPGMSQYSQLVTVWPVYANKLSANSTPTAPDFPQLQYTGAVRVTVRILYQPTPKVAPEEVYRTSWIRVGT